MKSPKYTYISLFSSAGIGCYGFKMEDFECVATNELIERRLNVQRVNHKCKYDSGYICDVFSEIADSNVDIYTSDLFDWGKNNLWYIDEATKEFGDPHDILRQLQQAQYYAYEQELYENKDDVIKYFMYSYMQENNIKAVDNFDLVIDNYAKDVDSNFKLEDIIQFCKDLNNSYEVA